MIKTSGPVGAAKRYVSTFQIAYKMIRVVLDQHLSKYLCFQMKVSAINRKVGTENMCPELLIFESLLRPALSIRAQPHWNEQI